MEGKSPNKHNKIYLSVEALPDKIVDMIKEGKIGEYQDKHETAKILREEGWPPDEARGVWSVDEGSNMLIEVTKGAQFLQEVKEMVVAGYRWGLKEGPLAYEQIRGIKVKISDISLHEDPVHRGPAQIMPMSRRAFFVAFLSANPVLLEPVQRITVKVPPELLGAATSVISQKRKNRLSRPARTPSLRCRRTSHSRNLRPLRSHARRIARQSILGSRVCALGTRTKLNGHASHTGHKETQRPTA